MYSGPQQHIRRYSAGLNITSAFVPTDVSGLVVWYKADAITGLNDADPVANWVDSSGNGRDAGQSTAGLRPVYKTAIINSLPVVRYDATDDALTTTSIAHGIGTGDWSFWAVGYNTDVSRVYLGLAGNGTFDPAFYVDTGSPHIYWNADYDWATTISNNTWYLFYWQRSGTTVSCYVNGVLDATTHTISDAFTTNSSWIVGNQASGSNRPFGGDIAEQGLYNTALSTANRQALEGYISAKYGIF